MNKKIYENDDNVKPIPITVTYYSEEINKKVDTYTFTTFEDEFKSEDVIITDAVHEIFDVPYKKINTEDWDLMINPERLIIEQTNIPKNISEEDVDTVTKKLEEIDEVRNIGIDYDKGVVQAFLDNK